MNLLWIYFSLWLGVAKQVEPVSSTHLTRGVNRSTCFIFNNFFFFLFNLIHFVIGAWLLLFRFYISDIGAVESSRIWDYEPTVLFFCVICVCLIFVLVWPYREKLWVVCLKLFFKKWDLMRCYLSQQFAERLVIANIYLAKLHFWPLKFYNCAILDPKFKMCYFDPSSLPPFDWPPPTLVLTKLRWCGFYFMCGML